MALWFARSQATVDEVTWIKGMIPHHSIAMLTRERADIADPRMRPLADGIIKVWHQDVDAMKAFIRDLENHR